MVFFPLALNSSCFEHHTSHCGKWCDLGEEWDFQGQKVFEYVLGEVCVLAPRAPGRIYTIMCGKCSAQCMVAEMAVT